MKSKRIDSSRFSKYCLKNNGYDDFRKLLLYLGQMWASGWNTLLRFIIISKILMILPDLATGFPLSFSDGSGATIGAYEVQSLDSIRSLKDGQWTDPTVWSTGKVPTSGNEALLLHAITIPSGVLAEVQRLIYDSNGHSLYEDSTSRLQVGFLVSSTPLRLKTVHGGSINTTYTYDSQNRLSTVSKADGSLAVIAYGDL
ncbi:hypothetical protein [Spirosoma arboris]|nr:hypothetical protein [Spirosoma arboris]